MEIAEIIPLNKFILANNQQWTIHQFNKETITLSAADKTPID